LIDPASAAHVMARFAEHAKAPTERATAQICSSFGPSMLGIVADASGDLGRVQKSIAMVSNATCLGGDGTSFLNGTDIKMLPATDVVVAPQGDKPDQHRRSTQLQQRATCKYTQVKTGDGCWALADRCGISQDDLIKFNGQPNFCAAMLPNQYVCCGPGTLPDFSPQPNKDGSCSSYTVAANDYCASIATAHSMTVDGIEAVNKQSWAWAGCGRLLVGQVMCLSDGTPPMPAAVANAVCGPQVPGTKPPPAGVHVADLNPCPLNACCNVWGQCGITPDFCTVSPSDTGAPGSSKPGINSCISHCGLDIPNVGGGPSRLRQLGYFESFAKDRACMNMDMAGIPDAYTDVHYSFAGITKDFHVDVSQYPDVWEAFKKIRQFKVVSFGGWSFSTDTDTFPIFRLGVTDAERQTFASNIVNFVNQNGLDGVDFDWEYPAAPDIPGIPAGDKDDGLRYLQFLKLVRAALPAQKTVSIAAPASFWYLKGFPIKEISDVVDYIVYMTYDLHGQWDYGNVFVNQGCPNGNCLRNHVNMTETNYALAMITKAGVPRSKVLVGMGSYGRSFKMSTPGCTGPECTFTGPASGATPGRCTGEPGYISNFEIQSLIEESKNGGKSVQVIQNPEGDVAIIDNTDWVGFMTPETLAARLAMFQKDNWGGTVEWAIDLNSDSYSGLTIDDENEIDPGPPLCDFSVHPNTLDDVANGNYPIACGAFYALDVLSSELDAANSEFDDANNGYDALFGYYVKYMKKVIPPVINNFMGTSGGGRQYFDCASPQLNGNATGGCEDAVKALENENIYQLHYMLRDKTGFFNDLLSNHGVQPDWIKFGEIVQSNSCSYPNKNDCEPMRKHTYGYPQEADGIDIPNPKDLVLKAGPNMSTMKDTINAMWLDVMLAQWDGPLEDVVPAMGLPVSLVKQAISNMRDVKKIGETEKEEEQKNLILNILGAIFALVPFIGEAGAVAGGLAQLGRVISIIGEVGNAALSIYDVVDNPSSAPMALFGILMGGSSFARTEEEFAKMGRLAKQIDSTGAMAKMGTLAAEDGAKIKKVLHMCAK
jgi:GH18 family chitinase